MKTEGTVFTQQSDNSSANYNLDSFDMAPAAAPAKATGPTVAQIAGAGVGGLVIGAVAMTLMSGKSAGDSITGIVDPDDDGTATRTVSREDLADGDIDFADSVSDDMSFSQAFAAARAEVGAGGAFVWHGTVYGTYTADEWQSMSPADREAYSSHFSWDNIDHGPRHEEHAAGGDTTGEGEQQGEDDQHQTGGDQEQGGGDQTGGDQHQAGGDQEQPGGDRVTPQQEPEIEVVEIVHDGTSGYVALNVDGQEAYYVDVDGDGVLDAAIYDANGDGVIQEEEIVDVHEEGITLEDFSEASGVAVQYIEEDELPDPGEAPYDDTLSEQDLLDI